MKKTIPVILVTMWNWLKKGIKWIFSDLKNFLLVLFAILAIIFLIGYKVNQHRYENTIAQATDTISVYKNKCDELYAANETYVTSARELKRMNDDLSAELKKLKDNPVVIVKTEYVFHTDTITIASTATETPVDSTGISKRYDTEFKYRDEWCSISGSNTILTPSLESYTKLNNVSFAGDIYTDIIEKNKKLYFISKSTNPYMQINNIEGCMISPEQSKVLKKRFNRPWGVMAGVGVSAAYVDNSVKICPTVSVIIGYKLISF